MSTNHALRVLFVTIIAVLLLNGCYAQIDTPGEYNTLQTSEDTHDFPNNSPLQEHAARFSHGSHSVDNQFGTLSDLTVFPSVDGKGFYYILGGTLYYYDIGQQVRFQACSSPGCAHRDESCPARIPGIVSFIDTGESWYAFCEDGQMLSLVHILPETGARSTICQWENGDQLFYYLGQCLYSAGRIYAEVNVGGEKANCDALLTSIELSTGTVQNILECNDMVYGTIVGASENFCILSCAEFDSPVQDLADYLTEHPGQTEEDYYNSYIQDFSQTHLTSGLRRYDLETLSYTLLDKDTDSSPVLFSDNNCCYETGLIYLLGNSIRLCNIETGFVETLVTAENIINGWLMDGRLFYLTYDTEIVVHVQDMSAGETFVLDNAGETDVVAFSSHSETDNAFVGLYYGQHAWIDKTDYYNGRYDHAVLY